MEFKDLTLERLPDAMVYLLNEVADIKTILRNRPEESRFISREEARKKLGISMPTLDKALKDGTLIGHRIRGRILLKETELSEFNNRKRK